MKITKSDEGNLPFVNYFISTCALTYSMTVVVTSFIKIMDMIFIGKYSPEWGIELGILFMVYAPLIVTIVLGIVYMKKNSENHAVNYLSTKPPAIYFGLCLAIHVLGVYFLVNY